jgi:hypothetical protein
MDDIDPALQRLNEWYAAKIQKNYTPKVADQVMAVVRTEIGYFYELEKIPSGERMGENDLEKLLCQFSAESMLRGGGTDYSRLVALGRTFLETGRVGEFNIQLSKGAQQEYLAPFLAGMAPFFGLVRDIQRAGIPPQEQDDEFIDDLFRGAFPTMEVYTRFMDGASELASILSEQIMARTREEKLVARLLTQIMRKISPIFTKVTIQDVYAGQGGGT